MVYFVLILNVKNKKKLILGSNLVPINQKRPAHPNSFYTSRNYYPNITRKFKTKYAENSKVDLFYIFIKNRRHGFS